jgi:hypothetical protein
MTIGGPHYGLEDGSERGGRTGAGTPTYDQRLAAAGESGSCADQVSLSDADRTGHLSKLYSDLICRLRLAKNAAPSISATAAAHGRVRHAQGYTPSMLIEESRVFQVATFGALQLHQSELDQGQVLSDVMVIADEVDAQLMETVRTFMEAKVTEAAA